MGGHALAHMSPGAPRRRLVPQPAPPCRGPYAGVQHRRRLRASGVGCSLAPSPTAPSPSASRRAKRSRLRVSLRRHQGDACALPPGLTRDPAQRRRAPARSSDHLGGRCSARAPLPPPPPLRPFPSVCLVCKSVLSVTCGVVVPSRGRVRSPPRSLQSPVCRVSSVDCRVRAAIARVIRGGLRTSNDAQKNGPHKCRLKDRHGTTDETRPADTPTPMRHGAALCGDRHTGRRTMHTVIACHAPAPTSGGRGAPANSSGEPACAAR